MNDAQLKAKLKSGQPGKFTVDRGLYFRVSDEGNGFWMLRYSINDKRREFVFARYGRPPEGTQPNPLVRISVSLCPSACA